MNMLALSIMLVIAGVCFLVAESFIPGFGYFGVTGIILIIASAVFTLIYVRYGIVLVVCEFGFIGAGVYLLVRNAKKKKLGGGLILNESLNEDDDSKKDIEKYVGMTGIAKTSLRPAGIAEIGGESVQVTADVGYIGENTAVKVKEVSGKLLIVVPDK